MKLKPEKNSGLNGIRTHDLCDTGAVLYQLSYQAIWELVSLGVRNIPVKVKDVNEYMKKIIYSPQFKYMIFHIFIYYYILTSATPKSDIFNVPSVARSKLPGLICSLS